MVKRYEGTIPKSGKQVFEFSGYAFAHRSIKGDRIDYLISIPDGWIIGVYQRGTERHVLLDDLAKKFELVKEFLNDPEGFNIRNESSTSEQTEGIDDQTRKESDQQNILPTEVRRVQERTEETDGREVDIPCYSRSRRAKGIILIGDAEKLELEAKGFIPF